jgi:hypothetical protein
MSAASTILRARAGSGMSQVERLEGRAFSARSKRATWRHPWWTTAAWSADAGWCATITKPGYVNGRAPIYRTTLQEQDGTGRDFGKNPLTGEPYFSSFVFAPATAPGAAGTIIDVPIYLQPAIPLRTWRGVGAPDGSALESVPQFFLERGIVPFGEDPSKGSGQRLVACDLILHQPRSGLVATITHENPFAGQSIVRQTLSAAAPAREDRLRVYSGTYLDPALSDELSGFDPLSDFYEEPTWDELRISTVYLLSPLDAKRNAAPDETWQPFVAHGLFWNLGWVPAPLPQVPDVTDDPNPLAGLAVLGAGLLGPIVNVFSAAANDLAQQALNEIRARSQKGTWWTPTGGGHTNALPPEPIQPLGGPNKAARQAQAAAAKQAAAAVQSVQRTLDPAFPYTAIGFDPQRFHLS